MTVPEELVVPAYLGWGNPERDTAGVRLYATDDGDSPRWDGRYSGGRVIEYALPGQEGDRYLVVRVGDRFTTEAQMQQVIHAVLDALAREIGGKK